jgi:hypothetical protein
MLEKCGEHSGWFPRGAWEAASQRTSRIVCDLLPAVLPVARRVGAQDGVQVKAQGLLRLGSLPAQVTPTTQIDPSTSEVACVQDGGPHETVVHRGDGLHAQGAHNLLLPAPLTNAAAVSVDSSAVAPREGPQTPPWREAFVQISKQLQVRSCSAHAALLVRNILFAFGIGGFVCRSKDHVTVSSPGNA